MCDYDSEEEEWFFQYIAEKHPAIYTTVLTMAALLAILGTIIVATILFLGGTKALISIWTALGGGLVLAGLATFIWRQSITIALVSHK